MLWMGTNALEMNVMGKMTTKATCWPTSTVGTDRPSQMPTQDIVNANTMSSTDADEEVDDAVVDATSPRAGR